MVPIRHHLEIKNHASYPPIATYSKPARIWLTSSRRDGTGHRSQPKTRLAASLASSLLVYVWRCVLLNSAGSTDGSRAYREHHRWAFDKGVRVVRDLAGFNSPNYSILLFLADSGPDSARPWKIRKRMSEFCDLSIGIFRSDPPPRRGSGRFGWLEASAFLYQRAWPWDKSNLT